MEKKRSWPAVSQIWNWTFKPLMSTLICMKSQASVICMDYVKPYLQSRRLRLVLPTPESPIRQTFTNLSTSRPLLFNIFYSWRLTVTVSSFIGVLHSGQVGMVVLHF